MDKTFKMGQRRKESIQVKYLTKKFFQMAYLILSNWKSFIGLINGKTISWKREPGKAQILL